MPFREDLQSAVLALTVAAILAPWAFGGVPSWSRSLLTLSSLSVSVVILSLQLVRREVALPPPMLLPFFGLIALGALQLVPLPASLHAALAPGSAELWHPEEPTAASVLGSGWRPISVHPTATLRERDAGPRAPVSGGAGGARNESEALAARQHRERGPGRADRGCLRSRRSCRLWTSSLRAIRSSHCHSVRALRQQEPFRGLCGNDHLPGARARDRIGQKGTRKSFTTWLGHAPRRRPSAVRIRSSRHHGPIGPRLTVPWRSTGPSRR